MAAVITPAVEGMGGNFLLFYLAIPMGWDIPSPISCCWLYNESLDAAIYDWGWKNDWWPPSHCLKAFGIEGKCVPDCGSGKDEW